jgi:hypothetical protein
MMIFRKRFSASAFTNQFASCLLMMAVSVCSIGLAHASEKTQSFRSDWTVSPWNYYGNTAAMKWHYIEYEPWDTALGELREVRVQTEILGEHESRAEDVRIRLSFFTGWKPADYQLSAHVDKPVNDEAFSISKSLVYDSPEEIQQWINYQRSSSNYFFFESRTNDAGHTISAITTLTYIYDSLPDRLVLELVDMVLNYEESSQLSGAISSVLLRDLDQVLTQIDQNNMQGACDGLVTFIEVSEELSHKSGMEVGAAMLLIAEANQTRADLYCS